MENLNFVFDRGVVDRWILQSIAEGFVVNQNLRARRDRQRTGEIPVVNQFVFGHGGATSLPCEESVTNRVAVGLLLGIRPVQNLAKFAAINLRAFTDKRFDFRGVIVPPLQMPGAELPFCILFIAGALLRFAGFYFRRGRVFFFRGWGGSGLRG